jgi:hypothetical protein
MDIVHLSVKIILFIVMCRNRLLIPYFEYCAENLRQRRSADIQKAYIIFEEQAPLYSYYKKGC